MASEVRVNEDWSLAINKGLTIPADEIDVRVSTSGGPGGQHANRSLTRVVVSFDVLATKVLAANDQRRLCEALGPIVRSGAGRFRSQRQNRVAALEQLGRKIAGALAPRTPRRVTKPSRGATARRVDDKKARGRLKEQRRRRADD
ncbi:MAG: aminoacyl-tRNA hydrolase [Acidimicrobiales bacterium]